MSEILLFDGSAYFKKSELLLEMEKEKLPEDPLLLPQLFRSFLSLPVVSRMIPHDGVQG